VVGLERVEQAVLGPGGRLARQGRQVQSLLQAAAVLGATFEVDDLQAVLDRLAGDGYGVIGGVGQYEDIWRMAYVRGPDGIIVSLAQRIG